MAENQRGLEHGIADSSVQIRMEVAATDTGRGDAEERLTGPGRTGMRDLFAPDIARAMERAANMVVGRRRFMAMQGRLPHGAWPVKHSLQIVENSCCYRDETGYRARRWQIEAVAVRLVDCQATFRFGDNPKPASRGNSH